MPAVLAEAPARIRETHVQDRTLSAVAGSPVGWRNSEWPIERAYESKRLVRPLSGLSEQDKALELAKGETRWIAFSEYYSAFAIVFEISGRDSTQLDVVAGGSGFPISEARSDAIKRLVSIDSHMAKKDRAIVRRLCEGWSLPGAVSDSCGDDFKFTVAARIREALDALADAIESARDGGYRYVKMGLTL